VPGVLDNGDTFTFDGSLADLITDFGFGGSPGNTEGINLQAPFSEFTGAQGPGLMGAPNLNLSGVTPPTNGLATDQGFFLVQGGYNNGTATFTVNSAGADTLVVYDGDSSAAVTQTGIVLSGVTLAELNAFTGQNFIAHI